ncbi:methyltransferase domain-containing protein [archaeon]|nr:MAG: methyltransferase domain-containing protein [archaeon]
MEFVSAIEDQVRLKLRSISGIDSDGKEYSSLTTLWKKAMQPMKIADGNKTAEWYEKANSYWDDEKNCPCSDDGVLGGYGHITPVDIEGSRSFLSHLQSKHGVQFGRVADCGAGIGRITKNLLKCMFAQVDLVEQSHRLITSAPAYINDGPSTSAEGAHITYIEQGLQHFAPEPNTYDIIWVQWVIGHLTDQDFISFIQRCVHGLKTPNSPTTSTTDASPPSSQGGLLILKDNVIIDPEQTFFFDKSDNSVCRHMDYLRALLKVAQVEVVEQVKQEGFPEELYPVYMIALRPNI